MRKIIEEDLFHFGETKKVDRRRYKQFVKNRIDRRKISEA